MLEPFCRNGFSLTNNVKAILQKMALASQIVFKAQCRMTTMMWTIPMTTKTLMMTTMTMTMMTAIDDDNHYVTSKMTTTTTTIKATTIT
jgi:hypothetical protein